MYSALCIENTTEKSNNLRRNSLWSEPDIPISIKDTVATIQEAVKCLENGDYSLVIYHCDKLSDYSVKYAESIRSKISENLQLLVIIEECSDYSCFKYIYTIGGIYICYNKSRDIIKSLFEVEVAILAKNKHAFEMSEFVNEFIVILDENGCFDDFFDRLKVTYHKIEWGNNEIGYVTLVELVDTYINAIKMHYSENVAVCIRLELSNVSKRAIWNADNGWDYIYDSLQHIIKWVEFFFPSGTKNKILTICVYIWNCYSRELLLNEISETFYLNSSYLSNKFSEQIGMTYKTYVNTVKCEIAKGLLIDGKISDVAYVVGFKNEEYFSKVFKKIVGSAPSEYREKIHYRVLCG